MEAMAYNALAQAALPIITRVAIPAVLTVGATLVTYLLGRCCIKGKEITEADKKVLDKVVALQKNIDELSSAKNLDEKVALSDKVTKLSDDIKKNDLTKAERENIMELAADKLRLQAKNINMIPKSKVKDVVQAFEKAAAELQAAAKRPQLLEQLVEEKKHVETKDERTRRLQAEERDQKAAAAAAKLQLPKLPAVAVTVQKPGPGKLNFGNLNLAQVGRLGPPPAKPKVAKQEDNSKMTQPLLGRVAVSKTTRHPAQHPPKFVKPK